MILASNSPRRRELLASLGVNFFVESSPAEELLFLSGKAVNFLPQENALRKAGATALKYPDELVLGADTLVLLNGRPLGKPESEMDAFRMLRDLSGKTHCVVTGMALIFRSRRICELWHEISYVRFKSLSDGEIEEYLDKVDVLDKAGSYAIQEHGGMLLDELDGEIENVIGLPLNNLKRKLKYVL